jgi:cytochrome c553
MRMMHAALIQSLLRHPWRAAGGVGIVIGLGAAAIVISGVVPIKASSRHWEITTRLLDFAKVRSVTTHAIPIQAPPLENEALARRGAGHYEIGCAPCHGRPGGAPPAPMAAMTPPPPDLREHVRRWESEQLFYIVKHGIKFTGMPAWPIQTRDDEVWAVVTFLRRLPDMSSDEYQTLVEEKNANPQVDEKIPAVVRGVCSRCHGSDGRGRGQSAFPSLAGQHFEYLYNSLDAFATRRRQSGTMTAVATSLDQDMMREAASYYSALPARAPSSSANATVTRRGESIATAGIPERNIPACRHCHGPAEQPRAPAYPLLGAQDADYLRSQLELLQQRRRGGSGNENLMHVFVRRLTSEDIEAVTTYYSHIVDSTPTGTPNP